MNTESIVIIIILLVLTAAIIGCFIFIGRRLTNELAKKRKLQEIMLYTEMFKNVGGIYDLLDSYINEKFAEYKIFNADKFEKALTNVQQNEIAKELTVDILDTMSPAFYTQLTLIFNPNKEKIHKLVNDRVVMAIIAESLDLSDENDDITGMV